MRKILTGLAFLAVLHLGAQAQTGPQPSQFFWFSGGLGAASVQNAHWTISSGFSGNYVLNKIQYGLRATFSQEFKLFTTPERLNEFSVYAGRYFRGLEDQSYAGLCAGISFVDYYTRGERTGGSFIGSYYHLDEHTSAGLALDLQAGINMGRFVSLGVHGFASLNFGRCIGGAMLSLRLGLLAEKRG